MTDPRQGGENWLAARKLWDAKCNIKEACELLRDAARVCGVAGQQDWDEASMRICASLEDQSNTINGLAGQMTGEGER